MCMETTGQLLKYNVKWINAIYEDSKIVHHTEDADEDIRERDQSHGSC